MFDCVRDEGGDKVAARGVCGVKGETIDVIGDDAGNKHGGGAETWGTYHLVLVFGDSD